MLIGQLGIVVPVEPVWAENGEADLVITGTGLREDIHLYESDWLNFDNPALVESYYSSNNNFNFHKIWKVKGYDFFQVVGEDNLLAGEDEPIHFISADGYTVTKSVYEFKNLYYYPDFTVNSEQQVNPMIGIYRTELYSNADPQLPISWQDSDRPLTSSDWDDRAPRLYLGQEQGQIDDQNQPQFNRQLVRIVVGEERPEPENSVLTVTGNGVAAAKTFTMEQLQALPAEYVIDEDYHYNSKSGTKTASVKGVDLWYVLNNLVDITDPTAAVQFICSDGFSIDPQTQANIADPNLKYVLAYEVNGSPVSDDNGKANLRIYRKQAYEGEFGTVFQSITAIEINQIHEPDDETHDFANSPYKHINYDGSPYNVDSITGATLTVEGPGVDSYRAISLRQIEEENAGLFRGTYVEKIGGEVLQQSYEGIKVSYLLDKFVNLKENAGKVVFKDKSRQTIAEYSLEDIAKKDYRNNISGADNLEMIIAYGINELPLVYTELDAGYRSDKYNHDGCFKLAVGQVGDGDEAPVFSNVAYIYVEEEDAPGIYEHSHSPYDDPKFTNYILTLSGSGLGKEVNFTVADLEAMTALHQEKEYSLSNSYYYWYYNKYKGVPLWDLLLEIGLDENIAENTSVNFKTADNYNFPPMTIGEIKDDSLWGYYEKDAMDMGDGNFDGSSVAPLETGYPVLIAYGYNGYPYVTHPSDPGYNSGLGNDGGPLRVIFGKKDYAHTNGSHQVKLATKIIIGEDIDYSTHRYSPYDELANSPINIKVVGEDGAVVKEEQLTVNDIENMIYNDNVPAATADKAREKNYYFTHTAGGGSTKISDLYEGVGLSYLLFEKIGLPGTTGTVIFENEAKETLEVSLEHIVKSDYFNEVNGSQDLKPVLAFAKNGYPMVKTKDCNGYMGNPIVNRNGPLMAVFGQTENGEPGKNLANIQAITVNVTKDTWAHLDEPYNQHADDTLTIAGKGVRKEHTVTVGQLELMQNYIFTDEYSFINSKNTKSVDQYRGIDIYQYIRQEVGFTAGATSITFKAADGYSKSYTIEEIAKKDYINEESGAANLKVMLAYGKNEKPLVPTKDSEGYNDMAANDGGPLRLVIGQIAEGDVNSGKSVSNVVEIVVEADAEDSWKHNYGAYTQYQDEPVLRVTGSQVKEPRTFTLRQLQELNEHIIRDTYNGETEVEGIILWDLIKDVVGLADGVVEPSSIRVFDGPNYNQLQTTSQVINGVKNSQGETKEIILGYAMNGYPLVPHAYSDGYVNNNEYGPLRVIVEENIAMWTKWVDCIVVGSGSYEKPAAEDIEDDKPVQPVLVDPVQRHWTIYQNDDGSGLPYASVRCITPDNEGGLWVGTNGGGAAYKNAAGQWTVYNKSNGALPHDTVYDIAVDDDGGVWFVGGSPEDGMGVIHKQGDNWTSYTTANSDLPADFAQAIAIDDKGGIWFGTAVGPVYLDADGQWISYAHKNFPANSVTTITLDDQGGVWFGFYPEQASEGAPWEGGFAYLDAQGNAENYTHDSTDFSGKWVRSISIDEAGGVWVASFGKVDYISPNGDRKTYESDREFLPVLAENDSIRVIEADDNGGLWIGTTTGGLYYRHDDNTFSVYNSDNTWPTNPFNSIWYVGLDDEGNLLLGTNGGVAFTNIVKDLIPVVFTITGDGVPNGQVKYTLSELKQMAAINGEYSYTSGGQVVKDNATGVSLAHMLAQLNITNPKWEVVVKTTDGYDYGVTTLQDIIDEEYLVTYLVNDGVFEDVDKQGKTKSSLRMYRNHDDGSGWRNRLTLIAGVNITDVTGGTSPGKPGDEIPENWILQVNGEGVDGTHYFTLDDLKSISGGIVNESYFSINNYGTKEYTDFVGISLKYLLNNHLKLKSSAESITITAADGFYRNYNLSDVRRDYIDENNPSARLPMLLAWKEDGSERFGSHPLRFVIGQEEAGDINKPNWIRNVMTITVKTSSVTSGSGTPGGYRPEIVPKEDMKQVDISSFIKSETFKDNNGRTIEEITVDAQAAEALAASEEGTAIVVSYSQKGSHQLKVMIPNKTLLAAKDKLMTIIVEGERGSCYLSPEMLPVDKAAKALGVKPDQVNMRVVVKEVEEDELSVGDNQQMIVKPLEYNIQFYAGDKTYTDFHKEYYSQYQLALPYQVDAETSTGAVWDQNSKQFVFVPSKFITKDGVDIAVIFSKYNSIYAVVETKSNFKDIIGHWAEKDIELMAAKLLVSGRSDEIFDTHSQLTRAEIGVLLARALGLPQVESETNRGHFSDVHGDQWFAKALGAVVNNDLIKGYADGTFRPNNSVSRQELAVLLARTLVSISGDQYQLEEDDVIEELSIFADSSDIDSWASNEVAIAVKAGIISGYPDGNFLPQGEVNRAQGVVMLKRFLQHIDFIN